MSDPIYLVWSNAAGMWWAPNAAGYRDDVWKAGRFDEESARKACTGRTWALGAPPPEVMVLAPEVDHPTFTVQDLRETPEMMRERVEHATRAAKRRPRAQLRGGESGE